MTPQLSEFDLLAEAYPIHTRNDINEPVPAPEPTSVILFGLGLAGLATQRLRNRAQRASA